MNTLNTNLNTIMTLIFVVKASVMQVRFIIVIMSHKSHNLFVVASGVAWVTFSKV